jgi:hypothetical protein
MWNSKKLEEKKRKKTLMMNCRASIGITVNI